MFLDVVQLKGTIPLLVDMHAHGPSVQTSPGGRLRVSFLSDSIYNIEGGKKTSTLYKQPSP